MSDVYPTLKKSQRRKTSKKNPNSNIEFLRKFHYGQISKLLNITQATWANYASARGPQPGEVVQARVDALAKEISMEHAREKNF